MTTSTDKPFSIKALLRKTWKIRVDTGNTGIYAYDALSIFAGFSLAWIHTKLQEKGRRQNRSQRRGKGKRFRP